MNEETWEEKSKRRRRDARVSVNETLRQLGVGQEVLIDGYAAAERTIRLWVHSINLSGSGEGRLVAKKTKEGNLMVVCMER